MIEKVNGIVCKVVEKEENVYFDMALTMLEVGQYVAATESGYQAAADVEL